MRAQAPSRGDRCLWSGHSLFQLVFAFVFVFVFLSASLALAGSADVIKASRNDFPLPLSQMVMNGPARLTKLVDRNRFLTTRKLFKGLEGDLAAGKFRVNTLLRSGSGDVVPCTSQSAPSQAASPPRMSLPANL